MGRCPLYLDLAMSIMCSLLSLAWVSTPWIRPRVVLLNFIIMETICFNAWLAKILNRFVKSVKAVIALLFSKKTQFPESMNIEEL